VVDKVFFIEGKQKEIFGVGFRPAIMGKAAEMGLKSAATNMPNEKNPKVQVLVSGSSDIITSFHNEIKNKDLRIMPFAKNESEKVQYTVTNITEYDGPNIDWSGYQQSMMTEQMSKGFSLANQLLTTMNEQISKGFTETNEKLEKGFKSIANKPPPRVKSAKKGFAKRKKKSFTD
jgi:acylphosphatase